jgi:hypothetical protein
MMDPAKDLGTALDALARRLADDVLLVKSQPNALTRFGDARGGPRGCVVGAAGLVASLAGSLRRMRQAEFFPIRDDYASLVGADETRANEDYHYVRLRVGSLSTNSDGDPTLIRPAARLLFRYVAAGRPASERLDGPEDAFDAIGAHFDGPRNPGGFETLAARYVDAWRTAIDAPGSRPSPTRLGDFDNGSPIRARPAAAGELRVRPGGAGCRQAPAGRTTGRVWKGCGLKWPWRD